MSLSLQKSELYLPIDLEINKWAKDLDLSKNIDYLNNLLNIGYNVSKSIKFNDNSNEFISQKLEYLSNISNSQIKMLSQQNEYKLDFLNQKIQELSSVVRDNTLSTRDNIKNNSDRVYEIVKNITGKTNISAHKGQIGENFIFNTLDQAYPNATIESLVSTPHQADIHIKFEDLPNIFIESKNYTNLIPKKEIVKFKDDLDRNNCDYGLFYSFGQKIAGIHNKLYIENYNNKKIIYISNIEFNKADVIFPIEFLKYIISNKTNYKKVDISDLTKKAESIVKIVKDLENLYIDNCKNIKNIEEQRLCIVKSLDKIQLSVINNQLYCKNIVEQIRDRVSKELVEFLKIENTHTVNELDLDEFNSKIKNIVECFVSIVPNKYSLTRDKNDILFKFNDLTKFKLSIGKSKVKLKIIEDDCTINLNEKNITKIVKYLDI